MANDYEKKNKVDFTYLLYDDVYVKDYNFNSLSKIITKEYVKITGFGFDGVLMDLEAIPFKQRGNFVTFLGNLKKQLPKDKILSIYAGAVSNDSTNVWEWNATFFKQVGNKCDLVMVSGFDSWIWEKIAYQNYLKYQIEQANTQPIKAQLMFIVPTHKNNQNSTTLETIDNALELYYSPINKTRYIGISVFAEWATDSSEWESYERFIKK